MNVGTELTMLGGKVLGHDLTTNGAEEPAMALHRLLKIFCSFKEPLVNVAKHPPNRLVIERDKPRIIL